jgi:hypothetical protein
MAWVRLDDQFHSHPKAFRAGLAALGLHAVAMSYCGAYLTDGHVDPEWRDHRFGMDVQDLVDRLCDVGMWHRNGNGYVIHDFLDYNPSAKETKARRKARVAAGRKGGKAAQAAAKRDRKNNQANA